MPAMPPLSSLNYDPNFPRTGGIGPGMALQRYLAALRAANPQPTTVPPPPVVTAPEPSMPGIDPYGPWGGGDASGPGGPSTDVGHDRTGGIAPSGWSLAGVVSPGPVFGRGLLDSQKVANALSDYATFDPNTGGWGFSSNISNSALADLSQNARRDAANAAFDKMTERSDYRESKDRGAPAPSLGNSGFSVDPDLGGQASGAGDAGFGGSNAQGGADDGGRGDTSVGWAHGGAVTPDRLMMASTPATAEMLMEALRGLYGGASRGDNGKPPPKPAKNGGPVTKDKLGGTNPPGPDDGMGYLDKGEHVWTADEVKKAGGHKAMERLRYMAKMGELKDMLKRVKS